MAELVCPWWLGYFFASPVRRLIENPEQLLGPYIREGMTILEPGPGMGFFTLPMAEMAGPKGRIVAVDIQDKMLGGLRRRAGVPRCRPVSAITRRINRFSDAKNTRKSHVFAQLSRI